MRRFSFSQPNIRSMILRCRYLIRSNSLGNPAWVCASCCAVESPVASDTGRSSDATLRRHSLCPPATIGSVCGGDCASWVCTPHRATVGRKQCSWPVRPTIETSAGRRWHRTAYGSWWSGRPGCARAPGLAVLQAPFFPAPEEARVASTAVESIIQVFRLINPYSLSLM